MKRESPLNIKNTTYAQRKLAVEVKRMLGKVTAGITLNDLYDVFSGEEKSNVKDALNYLGDEVFTLDDGQYVLSRLDPFLGDPIWCDRLFTTTDRVLCFIENNGGSSLTYADIADALYLSKDVVRKSVNNLAKIPEYEEMINSRVKSRLASTAVEQPLIPEQKESELKEAFDDLRVRLTPPLAPASNPRWKETLKGVDQLLGELGVPDAHLIRSDLKGVIEWL